MSNGIVELSIENFMGIKAFHAKPDGHIVQINGKNGAGKSSVLDAITAALGGASKKNTPMPIRKGEESAHIILETDELIVTRRYTKKSSTVEVTTKDGAKFPKAQAKLDSLLGKLSLDPFAFTQLPEKDQLEQLLGLVDLPFDPTELEQQRKALYEQRQEVGRQGKAIGEVEVDESLPSDEQSATQIINMIRAQQERNQEIADTHRNIEVVQNDRKETTARIQELQENLKIMDQRQKELQSTADHLGDPKPIDELEGQLAGVEDANAQIRANNDARARKAEQDRLRDEYQEYTSKIEALDKSKSEGLAKANMPVDGLGFNDAGVTFEDVPFKQANSGTQLRVSFAMAMALNPDLRVARIKEGSLLDEENMALIAEMAAENDFQVWIEVVGQGDGTGIVIEEGEVVNE